MSTSSKEVHNQITGRRRKQIPVWVTRMISVLIALILSLIIVLFFFLSGAVSR